MSHIFILFRFYLYYFKCSSFSWEQARSVQSLLSLYRLWFWGGPTCPWWVCCGVGQSGLSAVPGSRWRRQISGSCCCRPSGGAAPGTGRLWPKTSSRSADTARPWSSWPGQWPPCYHSQKTLRLITLHLNSVQENDVCVCLNCRKAEVEVLFGSDSSNKRADQHGSNITAEAQVLVMNGQLPDQLNWYIAKRFPNGYQLRAKLALVDNKVLKCS